MQPERLIERERRRSMMHKQGAHWCVALVKTRHTVINMCQMHIIILVFAAFEVRKLEITMTLIAPAWSMVLIYFKVSRWEGQK